MKAPIKASPRLKERVCPRYPYTVGKTPTPMKNATGMATEATTLLKWGGTILERAEKAPGKKDPVRAG